MLTQSNESDFLNAAANRCLCVPYNKRTAKVDNVARKLGANICIVRASFSTDTGADHCLLLYSVE